MFFNTQGLFLLNERYLQPEFLLERNSVWSCIRNTEDDCVP